MTFDETAQEVKDKTNEITRVAAEIDDLCNDVLRKRVIDSDVIDLSDEDKQKIITHYQTKKAELVTLVGELP